MSRPNHVSPAKDPAMSFQDILSHVDQTTEAEASRMSPQDLLARAEAYDRASVAAEAKGSRTAMLASYLSFCRTYLNTRSNPRFPEATSKDKTFRARCEKLKPLYEQRRAKAAQLKSELFPPVKEEAPNAPTGSMRTTASSRAGGQPPITHRSSPPVDNDAGGSIADRLRALRGHGMEVESSSKRVSQDFSPVASPAGPPPTSTAPRPSGAGSSAASTAIPASRPSAVTPSAHSPPPPHPSGPRLGNHHRGASSTSLPRPPSSQSMNDSVTDAILNGHMSDEGSPSKTHMLHKVTSNSTQSPSSPRQPLPPLPRSAAKPETPTAAPPLESDALDKFEKTFPSLQTFGRQFDSDGFAVPAIPGKQNGKRTQPDPTRDLHDSEDGFPSFPSLPSVPSELPGQSRETGSSGIGPAGPPPTAPDLEIDTGPSPPSPDRETDVLKRPASTPVIHNLSSSISLSPPDVVSQFDNLDLSDRHVESPSVPDLPARLQDKQPIAMPVPRPHDARGPSPIPSGESTSTVKPPAAPSFGGTRPTAMGKPNFPFTNSITPNTLRSYFINLSVDVLLLDVRPESELRQGYVGYEYVERKCHINVVWVDPTIIMREDMDSVKLEDALSVSSDAQRLAFENRSKYDLCVIYDTNSTTLPKKGDKPTPAGRLFSIIGENEFARPLPRFPALLIGGYEGWVNWMRDRAMQGAQLQQQKQQQAAMKQYTAANGHAAPSESSVGRLARQPNVQKVPRYAKDITENFNSATPQSMSSSRPPYPGHYSSASFSGGTSYSSGNYYSSPPSYSTPTPPARGVMSPPTNPQRSNQAPPGSSSSYAPSAPAPITAPPRASVHPGAGTRRQSSYDNQQYSGMFTGGSRPSIDYPQAHALAQVQPPPVAASHSLERYDPRPAQQRGQSLRSTDQLSSSSGVRYWSNSKLGITGLKNLGNTCYMNSTIQCLSATFPFARYFLDGRYKRDINVYNNLGTRGDLAQAFAELLGALWGENYTFLSPITFRKSIIKFKSDFAGSEQHDSQEFLSFVMDGLHEDLNRIKVRPKAIEMTPEREAALETLPPQIASDNEWKIYKMRNDSFIVDLFQGQYMNRMECLTCHKTSTVYDSFQWLTLDLPASKAPVRLTELLDRWVRPEILDGDEKWYCPRCKVNRRASKTLTLVRLPPVLLVQLKRFIPVNGGRFWNKSETAVNFPLEGLDLTQYVPPRQPTGHENMDDPRTQVGPFKYDLYGVSNHMGTLSSGHYTAYVRSGDQWIYCDDSRYTPARREDVMSRPGYILFYKRVL